MIAAGALSRRSDGARHGLSVLRALLILVAAFAILARPGHAQSILRDSETEAFFRDLARPLVTAAGLDPRSVTIGLVSDRSINAFATNGQAVFFNAGMILAADNANQIEGVLAHELGHVAKGDVVLFEDSIRGATGISILSLLLGVAAIAAGAGDAGMGIMAAGQQAALGRVLAFSRVQEAETDQAGAKYLSKAGISGRGSVEFFRKILNQEFRAAIPQDNPYVRSHPLTGDRISALIEIYERDPAWNTPTPPETEARFQRIKAKLAGYVEATGRTLQLYPPADRSVPARYARAYAYHKDARLEAALAEIDSLLSEAPADPYFLEVKGQILLESGKPAEAIEPLRAAWTATRAPLIAALLGHALIATDDPGHNAEARSILRQAVARDNDNPFAWYQLGIVYERDGDRPRAALATAERYNLSGVPNLALASGRIAMQGLPAGSPDWLRAQDIVMVSEEQMRQMKGRGR